jgi:hypothetical protein
LTQQRHGSTRGTIIGQTQAEHHCCIAAACVQLGDEVVAAAWLADDAIPLDQILAAVVAARSSFASHAMLLDWRLTRISMYEARDDKTCVSYAACRTAVRADSV